MKRKIVIFAIGVGLAACGDRDIAAESESVEALYGDTTYVAGTCSPEAQALSNEMARWGRIASATDAFEQCVTDRITNGTYRQCIGDPGYGQSHAQQIKLVMAVARSTNDLSISCSSDTNLDGNASANSQGYSHDEAERFTWHNWLNSVAAKLHLDVCTPSGPRPCRFAARPWPYSQGAGTLWHEVMHTHDYTHGADKQPQAKVACGYANDQTWHFQANTMPYIVGNCIRDVIARSGAQCGEPDSCAGSNRLRMIDSFDGTTCSCKSDPRHTGLGTVELENGELTDDVMFAHGDRFYGGWLYNIRDKVVATGDYDGDGYDEFIIKSGWGFALVTSYAGRFWTLDAHKWGTSIGNWVLDASTTFEGQGNLDGQPGEELILKNNSGVAVLGVEGHDLVLRDSYRFNSFVGSWWARSSDTIEGVGDFDDDGADEFIVRRANYGFTFVDLHTWFSGTRYRVPQYVHSLSASGLYRVGTRFGLWYHNATDTIVGTGNFDGRGGDDILIRSLWGLGVLSKNSSLVSVAQKQFGTYISQWPLRSTDDFTAVADFDGDGLDEVLIHASTGRTGIGAVSPYGGFFVQRFWNSGTRIGGWRLSSTDKIEGVGDFDGDGKADWVVRSGWGLGLIAPYSTSRLLDGAAHDTLLGAWLLTDDTKVLGAGRFGVGDSDKLMLSSQ